MSAIEKLKALDEAIRTATCTEDYSVAVTGVVVALPEIVAVLEAQADELAAHRSVAGGYIALSSVSDAALSALEERLNDNP